ncbi:MAG: lamin tail domain-containing protein [Candidatus Bathyarchaeota archaeon]|nr:lamin tail domain-containing protein [Candidatus Bathyarchaeota archaeon]
MCQKNYAALDWKIIKKTRVGHILLTILLILTICGALYFFAHLTAINPETIWRIDHEKPVIQNTSDYDEFLNHSFDESNIVVEIIDGDTIILENGSKIRLIGINAPEKGYLYYIKAKESVKSLILFQNIRLESDMEERDDYNRLLRYVFVDDIFVNLWLVEEGYAHVFMESGLKYENQLNEAETNARLQELGIWEKSRYSGHIILLKLNYNAEGNDDENLNDEYVILQNIGDAPLNMTGWTIKDEGSNIFTFPEYMLPADEVVTLHTGSGSNIENEIFWSKKGAVWNNKADAIYLRDEEEKLVLYSEYS